MSDATFCRIVMLTSSAFFAGLAGGLRHFKAAYLHHKIESIREVNRWLSSPKTQNSIQCMNLIGSLLLAEVCSFVSIIYCQKLISLCLGLPWKLCWGGEPFLRFKQASRSQKPILPLPKRWQRRWQWRRTCFSRKVQHFVGSSIHWRT